MIDFLKIHGKEYYSFKKINTSNMYYIINEPWNMLNEKWKKPDIKIHILYDFIDIIPRIGKSIGTKVG